MTDLNLYAFPLCTQAQSWLPRWLSDKEAPASAEDARLGSDPWVGKIPWRRKWQPTPVFLPGESHGQRSLVATVLRGTESDTTEHACTHIPVTDNWVTMKDA